MTNLIRHYTASNLKDTSVIMMEGTEHLSREKIVVSVRIG